MGTDMTLVQVAGFCEGFGLLNRVDERGWVETVLPTQQGTYWMALRLDTDRRVLTLRVPRLLMVREQRREIVGHALSNVNYTLLLGAFALDPRDGEVCYSIPVPFAEQGVRPAQLGQCLSAAVWILDRYLPALQQVCFGDGSVEEALGFAASDPAQALARAAAEERAAPPADGPPEGSGH